MGLMYDAAMTGLNTGLGLLMQEQQDRRQVRQQGKLQDLQIQGQKDMGRFNQQMALDLWDKTNYKAQTDQMRKAGLNVALMYNGQGAGGTTTGAQAGSVTGGQAPTGGGEIGMALQLGMQRRMNEAQIKVAESQAAKNDAEAKAIGGYKAQEAGANIANLASQTQLNEAKAAYQKFENTIKEIEAEWKTDFKDEVRGKWNNEIAEQRANLDILLNRKDVSDATKKNEIDIFNNGVIEQTVRMEKMRAETQVDKAKVKEINESIELMGAQADKLVNDVLVANGNLWNERARTQVQKRLAAVAEQRANFDTGTTAEVLRAAGAIGDAAAAAKGYKTKRTVTEKTSGKDWETTDKREY